MNHSQVGWPPTATQKSNQPKTHFTRGVIHVTLNRRFREGARVWISGTAELRQSILRGRQTLRVISGIDSEHRLTVLRKRVDTCRVCATASRNPSKITSAEPSQEPFASRQGPRYSCAGSPPLPFLFHRLKEVLIAHLINLTRTWIYHLGQGRNKETTNEYRVP